MALPMAFGVSTQVPTCFFSLSKSLAAAQKLPSCGGLTLSLPILLVDTAVVSGKAILRYTIDKRIVAKKG